MTRTVRLLALCLTLAAVTGCKPPPAPPYVVPPRAEAPAAPAPPAAEPAAPAAPEPARP